MEKKLKKNCPFENIIYKKNTFLLAAMAYFVSV